MKKFNFSRLFAAMIFVAVLVLSGCKDNNSVSIDSLVGTWSSSGGDSYTITASNITYDDGGWGFGWSAKIVDLTEEYIYSTRDDGKYYVTAYDALTENGCKFSNAYKEGGKTNANTLDEAKKEFTIDNKYFGYYGEYVKQ